MVDLIIKHDREYVVGTLSKMSKAQVNAFNLNGKLRHQIEADYAVELGKFVRTLDENVVLFFPTKTGLTGNGWAKSVWATEMSITPDNPFLVRILLGIRSKLYRRAYCFRYKSMGLTQITDELFVSQPSNCLYVWFNNHLYRVGVANIDGTMYMEKVPKQVAHTC